MVIDRKKHAQQTAILSKLTLTKDLINNNINNKNICVCSMYYLSSRLLFVVIRKYFCLHMYFIYSFVINIVQVSLVLRADSQPCFPLQLLSFQDNCDAWKHC